ncbi:MAG: HNH endonuclease [Oscillospiraceae bacterium]|nr:HNH endonuclease [Oscillospiraceae bacterium]
MKNYLTILEAVERTGVNRQTIYNAYLDGKIRGYQDPQGRKKIYLDQDSLDLYADNSQIRKGAIGNIRIDGDRKFSVLPGDYDYIYATTSDGGVVNFTLGTELTPVVRNEKEGHLTVGLMKDGEQKLEYVHQLVMRSQGHNNNLNKPHVHHINCKPADNRISNLLAVWPSEHHKLHRLLKDGKKDEYNELVKEIKTQNKEKLFHIPDPQLGERYCMYVNRAGLKAYLAGDAIPKESIKGQFDLWGGPTQPEDFKYQFDYEKGG